MFVVVVFVVATAKRNVVIIADNVDLVMSVCRCVSGTMARLTDWLCVSGTFVVVVAFL